VENFFIEYRDPLFGLIVFTLIVLVVAITNYAYRVVKEREESNSISKIFTKFDSIYSKKEFEEIIKCGLLGVESLLFLASNYIKNGDYEKAISIYLELLNQPNLKEHIFEQLGKAYLKSGFLHRSRDIFIEALRLYPRNGAILNDLLIVYEKLKDYKSALLLLDSLNELEIDTSLEYSYIKALSLIELNDKFELIKLYNLDSRIERLFFEFMARFYPNELFNYEINSKKIVDILWNLDKSYINFDKLSDEVKEIYGAKGYLKDIKSSKNFEFSILIDLNRCGVTKATLSFSYICNGCKHTFPIPFYRCPNCFKLLDIELETLLIKDSFETDFTF